MLSFSSLFAGSPHNLEIGDVVFREFNISILGSESFGHCGIYIGYSTGTVKNPLTGDYYVIEQMGPSLWPTVTKNDLSDVTSDPDKLWQKLIDNKIINENGKITGPIEQLDSINIELEAAEKEYLRSILLNHALGMITGDGGGIKFTTLKEFKETSLYWGGGTKNLTYEQRKKIVEEALKLKSLNIKYVSAPYIHKIIKSTDTNNNGELIVDEIQQLRCDGFVEVVYALAGQTIQEDKNILEDWDWFNKSGDGFIINGFLTRRLPETQFLAMPESIGSSPYLHTYQDENNDPKKRKIVVDDGVNGSGIFRLKVCKVESTHFADVFNDVITETTSTQIDEAINPTVKTLTFTTGKLDSGTYLVVGYDAAGNYDCNFFTIKDFTIAGHISDLYRDGISAITVDLSGNNIWKTTKTNSDGNYEFTNLEPGDYTVTVNPGNYTFISGREETNISEQYPNQTVNFSESNTNATFGSYIIWGEIKDVNGYPIDTFIKLSGPGVDQYTYTDINDCGYYQFKNLEPGTYTITPFEGDNLYTSDQKSKQITVSSSNIAVYFTGTYIGPLYTINGYIKDNKGKSIPNTLVELRDDRIDVKNITKLTDNNGYYEFTNLLKGGAYTITAKHGDYTFNYISQDCSNLRGNEQLNFTGSYIGNTYSIAGTVKDIKGLPVSGALVTLSGETNNSLITDNNGYYEFANLIPADYTITLEHEDYIFDSTSQTYQNLCTNKTLNYLGTLVTYKISGYIKDTSAVAIAGSTVTLSGSASATCLTDSNGYYEFTGLVKGDYTVTPQYKHISSFTNPGPNRNYTQLNSDTTNQNFVGIPELYTISGYVKDADGNAISGSTVTASTSAGIIDTITNETGYYELGPALYSKAYVVQIFDTNYNFAPSTFTYTMLDGNQTNQNFIGTIIPKYSISGYVKDKDGSAIVGSSVTLSGVRYFECLTDSNGYYEFTDVVDGSYALMVEHSEYIIPLEVISNVDENTSDLNLIGWKTCSISGYVKDRNEPIIASTVTLSVSYDATISTQTTVTDDNGYYIFENLPAGEYNYNTIDYSIQSIYENYLFTPSSRTYSSLFLSSLTDYRISNQNFQKIIEQPILTLSTELLDFDKVKKNESKTLTFTITNTNNGTLSGNITADKDWIKLSPTSFTSNKQIVDVTVDSLETDGHYTGVITIESNGGTVTINVKIEANCVLTKPNPYNPNRDNALSFYGSGVIPNDTTIQIFTVAGEHVKTLHEEQGLKEIAWDGRNENGNRVVSGLYIYASKSPEEKWVGKFTVLKK
ncbi:carboxypeptidase regulatory-like domain-containing protein [bacterium]